MAPRNRVIIDAAQLKKIKGSPAVMAELNKAAKKLARKANSTLKRRQDYPDYDTGLTSTGDNPHAAVFTRSNHAKYSNAKHQTLAKLPEQL